MVINMSYDAHKDILNQYKYKCGFEYASGDKCQVKCMDKITLIAHLKMSHGIMAKDVNIPKEDRGILHAIKIASGLI